MSTRARSSSRPPRCVPLGVLGFTLLVPTSAGADETTPVRTEWRSPPTAIVGMAVTGLGVTAATVGTIFFISDDCESDTPGYCPGIGKGVGELGWLVGAIHVAIGVPLIVSGVAAVDPADGRPVAQAVLSASPTRADLVVTF